MMIDFGTRLHTLRELRNVSSQEMSYALGLNRNYINLLENNKNYPTMLNFFQICEYLDITPKDFFDLDSDNPHERKGTVEKLLALPNEEYLLISKLLSKL